MKLKSCNIVFNEDHYTHCSAIFTEMVESVYTKVVVPKLFKFGNSEEEDYINGFDRNSYRVD
jgi:hypothetical protein